VLDVCDDADQLLFGSYPVIVGFRLPERLAGSREELIGFVSGPSLYPLCDMAEAEERFDYDVDVIRHDHVDNEVVKVTLAGSGFQDDASPRDEESASRRVIVRESSTCEWFGFGCEE
jgi:hypothetical protein